MKMMPNSQFLIVLLSAFAVAASGQEAVPPAPRSVRPPAQDSVVSQRPVLIEDQVSITELAAEALRRNPEILAAQKRLEAARQRPSQESSLPDPMVGLDFNNVGNPLPFAGRGTDPNAMTSLMLSQEIPYPGKLRLRGQIASKEAQAEFEQYQGTQLNVISRLKQAYYRRAYAYAAADVINRNLELLRQLMRITEARYAVGRAQQQDIFRTQTQSSILETRLVQLEREKDATAAEINSIVNRRPETPVGRPYELAPQPLTVGLDQLYAYARENAPMLRRDQRMIERAELAANLARKEYYPDFVFNGGYSNVGAMPDMYTARIDVKIPLYFFRKQRAGVAEQTSRLTETRRTFEATNQTLAFRVKDDFLMANASARLTELYSRAVIPQASLALESSLASYETGAIDFLSVLNNYVTVVEYEMNYYEELQNFYLALSRLEEMAGVSLIK